MTSSCFQAEQCSITQTFYSLTEWKVITPCFHYLYCTTFEISLFGYVIKYFLCILHFLSCFRSSYPFTSVLSTSVVPVLLQAASYCHFFVTLTYWSGLQFATRFPLAFHVSVQTFRFIVVWPLQVTMYSLSLIFPSPGVPPHSPRLKGAALVLEGGVKSDVPWVHAQCMQPTLRPYSLFYAMNGKHNAG